MAVQCRGSGGPTAPYCDVGPGLPAGEYLFDFRAANVSINGMTLAEWFVEQYLISSMRAMEPTTISSLDSVREMHTVHACSTLTQRFRSQKPLRSCSAAWMLPALLPLLLSLLIMIFDASVLHDANRLFINKIQ